MTPKTSADEVSDRSQGCRTGRWGAH